LNPIHWLVPDDERLGEHRMAKLDEAQRRADKDISCNSPHFSLPCSGRDERQLEIQGTCGKS